MIVRKKKKYIELLWKEKKFVAFPVRDRFILINKEEYEAAFTNPILNQSGRPRIKDSYMKKPKHPTEREPFIVTLPDNLVRKEVSPIQAPDSIFLYKLQPDVHILNEKAQCEISESYDESTAADVALDSNDEDNPTEYGQMELFDEEVIQSLADVDEYIDISSYFIDF